MQAFEDHSQDPHAGNENEVTLTNVLARLDREFTDHRPQSEERIDELAAANLSGDPAIDRAMLAWADNKRIELSLADSLNRITEAFKADPRDRTLVIAAFRELRSDLDLLDPIVNHCNSIRPGVMDYAVRAANALKKLDRDIIDNPPQSEESIADLVTANLCGNFNLDLVLHHWGAKQKMSLRLANAIDRITQAVEANPGTSTIREAALQEIDLTPELADLISEYLRFKELLHYSTAQ